jgi:hypothetical protein
MCCLLLVAYEQRERVLDEGENGIISLDHE